MDALATTRGCSSDLCAAHRIIHSLDDAKHLTILAAPAPNTSRHLPSVSPCGAHCYSAVFPASIAAADGGEDDEGEEDDGLGSDDLEGS